MVPSGLYARLCHAFLVFNVSPSFFLDLIIFIHQIHGRKHLGEQLSQDPLDRFSQYFHQMKAFWVQMNDLDHQGTLQGNQFSEN